MIKILIFILSLLFIFPAKNKHLTSSLESNTKPNPLYLAHLSPDLYCPVQLLTQRLLMSQYYPAQSIWHRWADPTFQVKNLNLEREKAILELRSQGFLVEHKLLSKNNLQFSALIISRPSSIQNGKWIIQATGNNMPIEPYVTSYAKMYNPPSSDHQYNLVMINGPGVGLSEGFATPKTMGIAQLAGIEYVESLNPKKLILSGFSLGGAAMGQAILNHKFKPNIEYLVISQMTFDKASNVGTKTIQVKNRFLKSFLHSVVQWTGCEMNTLAASKKLQSLKIPEILIHTGKKIGGKMEFIHDRTIPAKATLGYKLQKENITKYKSFVFIDSTHYDLDPLILTTYNEIAKREKSLE